MQPTTFARTQTLIASETIREGGVILSTVEGQRVSEEFDGRFLTITEEQVQRETTRIDVGGILAQIGQLGLTARQPRSGVATTTGRRLTHR